MEKLELFKNNEVSKSFALWVNNYPLSYHPLDMKRFEKFVVSLFLNEEEFPNKEFAYYLTNKCNFSSSDVEYFETRIIDGLSLLKTFVESKQ